MDTRISPPAPHVAGRSREGRAITWHGLACGDGEPETGYDVLFVGVFHGDEGISGDLLLRFLDDLAQTPRPQAARLAVLPVLNPDGLARNTRQNAAGVDLNRNWPTANWVEAEAGTPYYSGPAPASEPETLALLSLIETTRPKAIVTVHSPYKVINFDGPARALAEAMAAANGYPVVEDIGYPTPGSFGTWAGKERQIPVITLELPEDEPLEAVWRDNRQALWAALAYPARTGL